MKTRIYTEKDIRKARESGVKQGIRLTIDSVLSVITLKLQDKHGMSREELNQLSSEVNADFQDVLDDRVTLQEIMKTKKEEIDRNPQEEENHADSANQKEMV